MHALARFFDPSPCCAALPPALLPPRANRSYSVWRRISAADDVLFQPRSIGVAPPLAATSPDPGFDLQRPDQLSSVAT